MSGIPGIRVPHLSWVGCSISPTGVWYFQGWFGRFRLIFEDFEHLKGKNGLRKANCMLFRYSWFQADGLRTKAVSRRYKPAFSEIDDVIKEEGDAVICNKHYLI